jgi:hypothetical protein
MMRGVGRALLGVALAAACIGGVATGVAHAQSATTAVIVIDNGSSQHWVSVPASDGPSGFTALERAASVDAAPYPGLGPAVCAIDGTGNPPTSCLTGPNGAYWSYWRSSGGAGQWSYSGGGSSQTTVHPGDVEGWRYIDSSVPRSDAAPRSSPRYCDYVGSCAPPPTETPPPPPTAAPAPAPAPATAPPVSANVGGGSAPASSSTTAPMAGKGKATTGPDGSTPSDGTGDQQAAGATTKDDGTTSSGAKTARTTRQEQQRAAALAAAGGGGGGNGSPVGVLVVVAILVAVGATVVVVQRRRARAAGP